MPALPYMLAFAVGFVLMMVLDVVMGLLLFLTIYFLIDKSYLYFFLLVRHVGLRVR